MLGLIAEVVQGQAHVFAYGYFILEDVDEPGLGVSTQRLWYLLLHCAGCRVAGGLVAQALQRRDEFAEFMLQALLVLQPALGLLFQLPRVLAELVETEGAGTAGQAMQLVA